MKIYQNLLLLFLVCVSCTQAQKINGVSFVASGDSISQVHVNPVLNVNANYVSLMPFAFTRDLNSPEIRFNFKRQWFGESVTGVAQYAREFQKKRVKILVKPQVWVGRGKFTGKIKMDSEEDWKTLEKTYKDFILTYAKAANEIEAEMFCIGTELESFVMQRPDFWKKLIHEIRKVYKGKLTYAANWDEFRRVTFWNELDFIGVDAYFPLTDVKSPSVEDYEKGWKPHKQLIQQIQSKYQKPILFTEFGYRSVDFAGKEPWDAKRVENSVNFDAQSNGLQAIYNEFWGEDWFAGGFVWKWFINHERVGGLNNNRFTPQNKPSEKLLSKLYKQ